MIRAMSQLHRGARMRSPARSRLQTGAAGPADSAVARRGVSRGRSAFLFALLSNFVVVGWPGWPFAQAASGWTGMPTAQANGALMRTPLNLPVSRQSKLLLEVDTRWANNYGYRAVDVTVSSLKPATTDHLLTVRLYSGWQIRNIVQQDFKLPQGSTRATTTIAVPQYASGGQFIWWDAWVDGVKDKDLSISVADAVRRFGSNFGAATGLTFLAVRPGEAASSRPLTAPSTYEFEVLSLKIGEFPRRWIDYTCFDVVVLTPDELEALSRRYPAALTAILRWMRAGGELWLCDAGDTFERLAEISEQLGVHPELSPAAQQAVRESAESEPEDEPMVGWQVVRFRRGIREGQVMTFLNLETGESRVVRDAEEFVRLQNDPNFVVSDQRFEDATGENEPPRRWPRDSSEWFVEQRFGLGTVRAFRDESEVSLFARHVTPANVDPASEGEMDQMPRSLVMALRSTDRWSTRHGMAPDQVNREFVNLLVPGVGLAPVTEFRILITVFVLLIGPVNYWLLKRWRRLHLLVLTVPLAAALLTATLFAYATLSDGFGTTVRARSFTTLDQRTGEAACWTRLSYYSGLAPGGGLTMPDDLVLYPINPAWGASSPDWGLQRELVWEEGQARLSRGWLRSRTPTQYLTIRARKSPHRLDLAQGGGKLRAINRLGAAIHFVLVCDDDSALWVGDSLAGGSMAFLQPIEHRDAIRRFRKLVLGSEPESPVALSDDSHYAIMQRRQASQMYGRFGFQNREAQLATNVMNAALAELAGVTGRPALALRPRSYVAVMDAGPEVELGMRGAEEEASFHVVVAQW